MTESQQNNITTLVMFNSSVKIRWMVPYPTSNLSANVRTVCRLSSASASFTDVVNAAPCVLFRPLPSRSFRSLDPSLKRSCQRNTRDLLAELFIDVVSIILYVCVGVCPSSWQNLITARISWRSVDDMIDAKTLSPSKLKSCLHSTLTSKWRQIRAQRRHDSMWRSCEI